MNFQLSLSQKLDQSNTYFERLKKNPKKNFCQYLSGFLGTNCSQRFLARACGGLWKAFFP
jgi:hypothetical protein